MAWYLEYGYHKKIASYPGWRWMSAFLLLAFYFACSRAQDGATEAVADKMVARIMAGTTDMFVLECREKSEGLSGMRIARKENINTDPLVLVSTNTKECRVNHTFASCSIDSNTVIARVVITDLNAGETRQYACRADIYDFNNVEQFSFVNISRPATSQTSSSPTTLPYTNFEASNNSNSAKSEDSTDSGVPQAVLYICLILLVAMVIACVFLGLKIYRGHRQKQKMKQDDGRSIKSFTTDKSYYFSRGGVGADQITTMSRVCPQNPGCAAPPLEAAPATPDYNPNRVVMNYQRPVDGSGTLTRAGHLYEPVQYQEPWGAVVKEHDVMNKMPSAGRTPNAHLVKVVDLTDSSLTDTPPLSLTQGAPLPTQETVITSDEIEDSFQISL